MSESDNRKSRIKQENQALGVQHAVAAHTEAGRETKEQFMVCNDEDRGCRRHTGPGAKGLGTGSGHGRSPATALVG